MSSCMPFQAASFHVGELYIGNTERSYGMTNRIMHVLPEKCVGCRICEQWCAHSHGHMVSPSKTNIRVVRIHHQYRNVPVVCRQCGIPACIDSCKFGALSRDVKTGAVLVDQQKCTACRLCVRACPYGAVNYDTREKTVRICNLCNGAPQCVMHCPEQALEYRDGDSITDEYRYRAVAKRG